MKGFKEFIMRGNLVEIAVGLIIALAFAEVVDAMVTVLMDLIGKVGGTPNFSGYTPGGVHVGAFLTALIAFVILAAVVYFLVVVPYNKLMHRMARGEERFPPTTTSCCSPRSVTCSRPSAARAARAPLRRRRNRRPHHSWSSAVVRWDLVTQPVVAAALLLPVSPTGCLFVAGVLGEDLAERIRSAAVVTGTPVRGLAA